MHRLTRRSFAVILFSALLSLLFLLFAIPASFLPAFARAEEYDLFPSDEDYMRSFFETDENGVPIPTNPFDFLYEDPRAKELVITGYTGTRSCIVIPSEGPREGQTVVSIGKEAFSGSKLITKVWISDGVRTVEDSAFAACSKLTSVRMPESLTKIGEKAFIYDIALSGATFPGAESIGYRAFYSTGLTSVLIPATLKEAGNEIFDDSALYRVILEPGLTEIFDNLLARRPGLSALTIPDSVTRIGTHALAATGIEEIDIPDSVTEIGNSAFHNCASLVRVTLPDGLTAIGPSTFEKCVSLREIVIPEGVTSIGAVAFKDCENLSSVVIPSTLTSLGTIAFKNCSVLTAVTLPDAVPEIKDETFYNCSLLTEFTVPASCTAIGKNAFHQCSSLASVSFPEGLVSIGESAFGNTALKEVSLPDTLTAIGKDAFRGCRALTKVRLSANLKKLEEDAFLGALLQDVTVPGKSTQLTFSALHAANDGITVHCLAGSKAEKALKKSSGVKLEYIEP